MRDHALIGEKRAHHILKNLRKWSFVKRNSARGDRGHPEAKTCEGDCAEQSFRHMLLVPVVTRLINNFVNGGNDDGWMEQLNGMGRIRNDEMRACGG